MFPYVNTRVVTDMRDGLPPEQAVIVCMDEFVWNLARDLVYGYGTRLTTFATAYEIGGYAPPDDTDFDDIQARIADFLKERDMSCDLSELIQTLTATGCGCGCGGGSFGSGSSEPAAVTFEDTGTNWPDGFSDRSEYDTYKCAVSNRIIAGMERDMDYLALGNILSTTVTVFILSLFTPIPFDDIVALFGVAVALMTTGVLVAAATAVSSFISTNKTEIVCALFQSDNSSEAKSNLNTIWDDNLTSTQALLAKALTWYSSMNGLFSRDVLLEESGLTMGVDCASCGSPHYTHIGTYDGDDDWSSEETDPTTHHVAVAFYAQSWTDSIEPTRLLNVDIGALVGFTPKTDSTHAFRARPNMSLGSACAGWTLYCQDTEPAGEYCMKKISLRSTTAFTVHLNFGTDC